MSKTATSGLLPAAKKDDSEKLLAEYHKNIVFLKENFDIDSYEGDKDILAVLKLLRRAYYGHRNLEQEEGKDIRLIPHEMIKCGVSQILCQIFMKSLPREWFDDDGDVDDDVYKPLSEAAQILFNYTDSSEELGANICRINGFVESLILALEYYLKETEKDTLHSTEKDMQTRIIGIIYNCANMESNKSILRRADLIGILFKYMNRIKDQTQILCGVLALAGLMTEEESKLLNADSKGLKYLLTHLDNAIKDNNLRSEGWSARELAVGVKNLANNDANKSLLVDLGILTSLGKMSQLNSDDEQHAALNAILALSFADTNKDKIITEPGLLKRIRQLQLESTDENTKKAAERILWNIREDLKKYQDHKNIGVELCGVERHTGSNTDRAHVMISYNWTHQPLLLKVRDKIQQRGYKTWMDVDDMEGSTLESMADAVEKAGVVLVCLSQQYKDSQFCRLEVEYAFKCRKPLIPLMLEHGYKPDGWLGLVIGNALYYNISDESFDEQIQSICKALEKKGLAAATSQDVCDGLADEEFIKPVKATSLSAKPEPPKHDAVGRWDEDKMKEWLRDKPFSSNTNISQLTGSELVLLWDMYQKAPDQFYKMTESQLQLVSISALTSFVGALKELFQ